MRPNVCVRETFSKILQNTVNLPRSVLCYTIDRSNLHHGQPWLIIRSAVWERTSMHRQAANMTYIKLVHRSFHFSLAVVAFPNCALLSRSTKVMKIPMKLRKNTSCTHSPPVTTYTPSALNSTEAKARPALTHPFPNFDEIPKRDCKCRPGQLSENSRHVRKDENPLDGSSSERQFVLLIEICGDAGEEDVYLCEEGTR